MVMPTLLRSLRVESFSTHSFIDPDEQAILAADLPAFTSQTARLVEAMGANVGVVLDRAAERIVLIDEQAREIPADAALHLMIGLVARTGGRGRSSSRERLASRSGSPAAYGAGRARRASPAGRSPPRPRRDLRRAPDGGVQVPEFQPGFDAIMSIAKVLSWRRAQAAVRAAAEVPSA
jgi:hypothetical protein